MKPSSLVKALNVTLDARRPAFVWGAVGVGKSDIVDQTAKDRKVELRDVRLALMDPVDIKGFPVPDLAKKQMSWLPADWLPTKGKGILFFDEMNSAPQSVQASAYQLILNRAIGNYKLPAGWDIIAAGNRTGDRSVVHAMPAALANRFVHLDLEPDLTEWCTWAVGAGISTDIVAFIRFRANLLHNYEAVKNPRAFATPRTWAFMDKMYETTKRMPADVRLNLYSGTVGEGPAGEFVAFVDIIRDLPSIDEILTRPTEVPVPTRPATKYAVMTGLARAVTIKNFDKAMEFVNRVDLEFQVLFMRDALAINDAVTGTAAFAAWGIAHGSTLT
jgi:hypothetical protein